MPTPASGPRWCATVCTTLPEGSRAFNLKFTVVHAMSHGVTSYGAVRRSRRRQRFLCHPWLQCQGGRGPVRAHAWGARSLLCRLLGLGRLGHRLRVNLRRPRYRASSTARASTSRAQSNSNVRVVYTCRDRRVVRTAHWQVEALLAGAPRRPPPPTRLHAAYGAHCSARHFRRKGCAAGGCSHCRCTRAARASATRLDIATGYTARHQNSSHLAKYTHVSGETTPPGSHCACTVHAPQGTSER